MLAWIKTKFPLLYEWLVFASMCCVIGFTLLWILAVIGFGLMIPQPFTSLIWVGIVASGFSGIVLVEFVAIKLGYTAIYREERKEEVSEWV